MESVRQPTPQRSILRSGHVILAEATVRGLTANTLGLLRQVIHPPLGRIGLHDRTLGGVAHNVHHLGAIERLHSLLNGSTTSLDHPARLTRQHREVVPTQTLLGLSHQVVVVTTGHFVPAGIMSSPTGTLVPMSDRAPAAGTASPWRSTGAPAGRRYRRARSGRQPESPADASCRSSAPCRGIPATMNGTNMPPMEAPTKTNFCRPWRR